MSPPKAKPPARPIEMPRTEGDLDEIMKAIEAHQGIGHQIGAALNEGDISPEAALDKAGERDDILYSIRDRIQKDRADERDEEIKKES
jgi:hypothetical protein